MLPDQGGQAGEGPTQLPLQRARSAPQAVADPPGATAERLLADRRLQGPHEPTGPAWWEWETGTGRLRWSEGMQRLAGLEDLGRPPTVEDWTSLLDPDDVERSAAHEKAALEHGTTYRHVFRIRTPAGQLRYLESWSGPLLDDVGRTVGLRGATLDISEREATQRALAASEQHFRATFDHAPQGMAVIWLQGERAGRLLRANDAFARLLGRTGAAELVGLGLADWMPPGERRHSRARFRDLALGRSQGTSYPRRYQRADGTVAHVWVTTAVVHDQDGRPEFAVAHCIDDTERRRHQRELELMAHTDALTGLANRVVVERELGSGDPTAEVVAGLLLLDLDRFKLVNDSQGHIAGDALLVQVANRLRATVPRAHTVARLGGDEFVVVLRPSRIRPTATAAAVVQAMREPFDLPGGEHVAITTSVGVALAGPDGATADLLSRADLALYEAKDTGRDRVACYDEQLHERTERRIRAEVLLRAAFVAVEQGRPGGLRVVLQPVVRLVDGEVVSAEALVRLSDADGTDLHTGDLVTMAEDTGLVVRLDRWVMTEVVRLLGADTARRARGEEPLVPSRVAVNVSGRTVEDVGFAARVAALLREHDVPPVRLVVELTETSLLHDTGTVEDVVAELLSTGVEVGLDDFGTGYSALAYLPRFRLGFLKIDVSVVRRLGTEPRADAVVAAIVRLAHAHDLTVVAEGVETAEQAAALRGMGCEHGQGWLFGRPAPVRTD